MERTMGLVRIMCFVLGVMIFAERSDATVYQVGDATGWQVPTQNDFYDNWADNKVFRVGDELNFTWVGTHDVAVVTETQHESCTKVTDTNNTSPVLITLTTTGKHYYICTIGSHCTGGQKLEIEVGASNTPGSPPSTNTTGTTNGTISSPPPPSSAASFAPIGALCATISFLVFSFLA